ncbi:MAG: proline--tRNA ligase [Phycisphaerae bacterium]
MADKHATAISPTRTEDYPGWYQQVVREADLAEPSAVRGCMVIKPWGYALWENIQRVLDGMFKATGHKNAYFPLFIPLSYLEKEAKHVEGFAKECAVVTHHRLEQTADGRLTPASPLEEPLIVRPTSETIIGATFANWVQSYRDLPLLINQWANVVRWEMRPRLFLRTTEFLWQEGHTVHATADEARAETMRMLGVYADFAQDYMAMPVIKGEKTAGERFPGAVGTYCIEAMMQDRKALQSGTSHFLGQNFARASDIKFLGPDGRQEYAWTTSWGVSTRLVGALIMAHGDDDGLVLPPRLAPAHVVILPIIRGEEVRAQVMEYCNRLADELAGIQYAGQPVRVELDARDMRGGDKVWSWIKRGVPIRVEVGARDIPGDSVSVSRRDRGTRERQDLPRKEFVATVSQQLDSIQQTLFERALALREDNTRSIDSKDEFYDFFTPLDRDKPEIHGGFAMSHFSGDPDVEEMVKKDLNVTVRCIPTDGEEEDGTCVISGRPSKRRVVFAKAY